MIKEKTVTVVIPCYNEGVRVLNVLKAVKQAKLVNEIIVVDDSSDEETKKILNKIDGIKIITHPKNLGKSQAMKTGVLNAKSEVIVFVDADLFGFKGKYIDELVKPIINGRLDLVLGDREDEFWASKLLGLSVVLTGERAMEKKLLLDNIKIFDHGGYLAEVAMNKIFFKNKKVGKVFLKGVGQILKYKKYGLAGCLSDLKFFIKVIKMVGLKEIIKQVRFIRGTEEINYL